MALPISNRLDEHDGVRFRCPGDLARSPVAIRRVLLVGQCTADHIRFFLSHFQRIDGDFVHIATMSDPATAPPRPIGEYDLQILILPLDYIMPIHGYFPMRYADVAGESQRYATSLVELERLLSNGLRWNQQFGLLTLVGNFLTPQQNPVGRLLPRYDLRNPRHFVDKLNEALTLRVEELNNAFMLDLDGIVNTFGKKYVQDDSIYSDSHGGFIHNGEYDSYESKRDGSQRRLDSLGPITSYYSIQTAECCHAVGEEIISTYRSLRRVDAVKLVVIDLDDTAWRGVAAEEELSHESLTVGWPTGFIEALMYLKRRGILLAIISKNEMENAARAWEYAYGHLFPLANFVSLKVNWKSKAENMEQVLAETGLLPKSVLYIDDNPAEREAIRSAFPDIRVLGANPYYLRRILLWSAELQQVSITDESAARTEMVQSQIERETTRRQMSHGEFLASLAVTTAVHVVSGANDPKFPRTLELLNRTNQFNTTGRRWTFEQLAEKFSEGLRAYTLDVTDRFSKYGLVCIALVQDNRIEQFVMSCRVIGLGVEIAAIAVVEAAVKAAGFDEIFAVAVDTPANQLSRDLYAKAGYIAAEGGWMRGLGLQTAMPDHVALLSREEAA